MFRIHDVFSSHWISAAIGERGRHDGKVPGVDVNRTLSRIEVRRLLWVIFDTAVSEHQFSDRLISLVCSRLRLVTSSLTDSGRPAKSL